MVLREIKIKNYADRPLHAGSTKFFQIFGRAVIVSLSSAIASFMKVARLKDFLKTRKA
jgi:hypothetical protein